MKITEVHGLRIFLYSILELIKKGKTESCQTIEDKLSEGIASFLYKKYVKEFNSLGFNCDYIDNINEYYKEFIGIADGEENKYCCFD